MWSLLWPWAWIIIPGSHSASSDRKRGEKSSHFSRTDAVWSPKSILRTSSHGTSSSCRNRGPASRSTMNLPLPKILSDERISRTVGRTPGETGMGTSIEIRPLTLAIGAEIGGVDLRLPLADDEVSVLRQALLDHLVVFFRDQHI